MAWSYGSIANYPINRIVYTATLLSNGMIAYIGGREKTIDNISREVDINQIDLYDTKLNNWSVMRARSINHIESRYGHSAVLVQDENIIINGGSKGNSSKSIKPIPDLIVLNTQTTPYEWIVPQTLSNIGVFPSLTYHTANLFENYMIVAFGLLTHPNGLAAFSRSNKIFLLDIRNYTWVDKFEPKSISNSTSSNKTSSASPNAVDVDKVNTMKVVIGTISGILGTAIFMTIGFLGYKWYQKHKQKEIKEIIRIPGNTSEAHSNNL
ncbi:20148_t:CDS:2 [Funneliformis geosporum]|nr:20148_t:CDS:2 [Funneliformis geosporum]